MATDSDGAHLDADGVRAAMSSLGQAADTFHTSWSAATANGTGGLGQGPMGAGFLAGFTPGAQRLSERAARIAQSVKALADAGHAAVADYEAADTAGHDAFERE